MICSGNRIGRSVGNYSSYVGFVGLFGHDLLGYREFVYQLPRVDSFLYHLPLPDDIDERCVYGTQSFIENSGEGPSELPHELFVRQCWLYLGCDVFPS